METKRDDKETDVERRQREMEERSDGLHKMPEE